MLHAYTLALNFILQLNLLIVLLCDLNSCHIHYSRRSLAIGGWIQSHHTQHLKCRFSLTGHWSEVEIQAWSRDGQYVVFAWRPPWHKLTVMWLKTFKPQFPLLQFQPFSAFSLAKSLLEHTNCAIQNKYVVQTQKQGGINHQGHTKTTGLVHREWEHCQQVRNKITVIQFMSLKQRCCAIS